MLGYLLSRLFLMVFGYIYPAFECFKTVEKNKPEINQLVFWCKYWILIAMLTVCERVTDLFISWVPFYGEAKILFIIYLWHPRTRGATYIYNSFVKPYVIKYEKEIDCNIEDLRNKALTFAILLWQKAATCGQRKVFDILQYASSKYESTFRSAQAGEKGKKFNEE